MVTSSMCPIIVNTSILSRTQGLTGSFFPVADRWHHPDTSTMGLLGVVKRHSDGWAVTLFEGRAPVAVVRGSWGYVRRGLSAVGLGATTTIAPLFEDRNGRERSLVGGEPTDGNT
jgi:hypothetical protein